MPPPAPAMKRWVVTVTVDGQYVALQVAEYAASSDEARQKATADLGAFLDAVASAGRGSVLVTTAYEIGGAP